MRYTQVTVKNGKAETKPYTFPNKREEKEYIEICEMIWGCVPVDVSWAKQAKPYVKAKTEY